MKFLLSLAALLLLPSVMIAQEKVQVNKLQKVQMSKADGNMKSIRDLHLSDDDRLDFRALLRDYKLQLVQIKTDHLLNAEQRETKLQSLDETTQLKINQSITSNNKGCSAYVKDLRVRADIEGIDFIMADLFGGEGCNGCGNTTID